MSMPQPTRRFVTAAAAPIFFGEERRTPLRSVVSDPTAITRACPIVNHRERYLALRSAHLIICQPMDRGGRAGEWSKDPHIDRRFTIVATLFQFKAVLACCPLPTQLPRQPGHRVKQRPWSPAPTAPPWKILHPYSASRALYPARTVRSFKWQLPHGQIAPFPLLGCRGLPSIAAGKPRKRKKPLAQPSIAPACHSPSLPPWSRMGFQTPTVF